MLNQLVHKNYSVRLMFVLGLSVALVSPVYAPVTHADTTDALLDAVLRGSVRLDDSQVRSRVILIAKQLTPSQRYALVELHYEQTIGPDTDLEVFARIAEFAAALADGNVETFMLDINRLTLDATSNWYAVLAGIGGRLRQRLHTKVSWLPAYAALGRFGSEGFAADDGSNQVQHVWYSVAVAFKWGATLVDLEAQYHELNPAACLGFLPGTGEGNGLELDLALSRQGIALGRALATGQIKPGQVGEWLRGTLGRYSRNNSTTGTTTSGLRTGNSRVSVSSLTPAACG